MRTGTVVLLVIGALMLVFGLAGLGGVVTLSLTPPGPGTAAGGGIAAFNYTTSGNQTLYITTANAVPSCSSNVGGGTTGLICKATQTLSFGDGTNTTKTGSLSHIYSKAGTYTMVDVVTFGVAPYTGKSTAMASIVLPGPGAGAVSSLGSITPSFTTQIIGPAVTFTDTSTAAGGEQVMKTTFAFGDGKTATIAPHGNTTHTYAQSGTYGVQETVQGITSGITYYAYGNVTVVSAPANKTVTYQNFAPVASGAQATSMAISGFLAAGGLVILITAAVPIPVAPPVRFGIVLVVGIVVGLLAYTGLGGPL